MCVADRLKKDPRGIWKWHRWSKVADVRSGYAIGAFFDEKCIRKFCDLEDPGKGLAAPLRSSLKSDEEKGYRTQQ